VYYVDCVYRCVTIFECVFMYNRLPPTTGSCWSLRTSLECTATMTSGVTTGWKCVTARTSDFRARGKDSRWRYVSACLWLADSLNDLDATECKNNIIRAISSLVSSACSAPLLSSWLVQPIDQAYFVCADLKAEKKSNQVHLYALFVYLKYCGPP